MNRLRIATLAWASSLLAIVSLGCDDAKPPEASAPSATAAALPAAPAAAAASLTPVASTTPPAAPKVKKRLQDCPKDLQIDNTAVEQAIRLKLPKESGAITKGDLARLRSLNLSQVELTELDVCLFAPMTGLKELFLGPGSYDDLSPIAGAKQLESLRASVNQVRDIKVLAGFKKLDRLDLGRTQVSDLSPLAELTSLTELQLDDTPVDDLSPLAKLVNLENLSVKRTRVKDANVLKPLKKLKFLYIGGSPLDDDPMSVGGVRGNGTKVLAD